MSAVEPGDLPEPAWLVSADSMYWELPRRAHPRAVLAGPDPAREYLLLDVDPPEVEPDPEHPTPRHVVVTPRHQRTLVRPEPGRPLRLHLWVVDPSVAITGTTFTPPRLQSDYWVELWSSVWDAQRQGGTH
ncbi:MAG TPA: hypothetical protein VFX70_15890 [Mycobacteriales bacterium]|nr:hypothetical protein [Mycobacteriales bacterium]